MNKDFTILLRLLKGVSQPEFFVLFIKQSKRPIKKVKVADVKSQGSLHPYVKLRICLYT